MKKNITQEERLNYLVEEFKADSDEYKDLQIPGDVEGKQRILRSLMNIRMPKSMPDDILEVQNDYLKARSEEKGVVGLPDIPVIRDGLSIWQGDITRLAVDAIVNAANSQMLGCFVPIIPALITVYTPIPDEETRWAWWARHIYFNRYIDAPKPVYKELLELVKDKDYFVITTNVDHQFQKASFDKKRLFYTQGDYGLFQTVDGRNGKTYDNEEWVTKAMEAQGFVKNPDDVFQVPEDGKLSMRIPTELIPKCPDDGSDVTMNLRADDTFVEDESWHRASAAYSDFLRKHDGQHILFLELGVGVNTPVIVKYPFWQMTMANDKAVYACINYGEAFCPDEIECRSICIDGDIGEVLALLN